MAVTPNWQAATTGQSANAGHINQFLGSHAATLIYTGATQAFQTTAGGSSTNTNGTWLAQSFATTGAQTTLGWVQMPISTTTTSGANLAATTLSLYANSAGAPTGAALVSSTVTAEYANKATGGVATAYAVFPLPITTLTASTTYWLVLQSAGNVSNNYTWFRSNQVSGASTSPNGTTWTAQGYGFQYQINDLTASGTLVATWEDSGARWTSFKRQLGTNLITTLGEFTAGQTASGYLQSFRTIAYTGAFPTGVS